MTMTPQQLKKKVDLLKSQKANWENYFQDLATFCLPRKAFVTQDRAPGQRLNFARLFDSVAIRSLQTMAAGFASHLTNPNSKWFSLATRNKKKMAMRNVKVWFKEVNEIVEETLSNSNFYPIIEEFYLDSGCFGTGSVYSERDPKSRVRYTSIPIRELLFEEDHMCRVGRVYRLFKYTVQQMIDRWGLERVSDNVKRKAEKKEDRQEKIEVIHGVYPRDVRDASKEDALNKAYASMWMERETIHPLVEGGYDELPYGVGRFNKENDEAWGFSPAMNALADIFMINAEKKTLIRGAMKVVDPAVILASKGFMLPFNLNPSGVNYLERGNVKEKFTSIETKGNIGIGMDMIMDVKNDIEEAFYVPLFKAFSQITKQMTVPEVQKRIEENMALLGPVVGRHTQEVLSPQIVRTFNILFEDGYLPPPPPEIQGEELDVVFVSALARAQRKNEIVSIDNFLTRVANMAGVLPDVLDKVDADKAVDVLADIEGIDPEILRSHEAVRALREARAQQQMQATQMEAVEQGAGAADKIASAESKLKGMK